LLFQSSSTASRHGRQTLAMLIWKRTSSRKCTSLHVLNLVTVLCESNVRSTHTQTVFVGQNDWLMHLERWDASDHCAKKDIWMHDKGDQHEHIAVHVHNLMLASKDPETVVKTLIEKQQFKLNATSPAEFHLGCDFFRDEEGVLCTLCAKEVEKILENYRWICGAWPKPTTTGGAWHQHVDE